ncbi:MAG: hypothetical protein R2811_04845 [Flavobacteriales bacterium]
MPITRWSLFLTLVVLVICSSNINWGKEHWRTVLQVDARGYHAYLPALIIEGDPNFSSFDAIERIYTDDPAGVYDYRASVDGVHINKYFLGTALVQLPVFLAAHGFALITDQPADGWSKPYVVAVNLSAIASVLLGLWCLARLLGSYGVRDAHIAFTLTCFTFGTNLFYYTIVAPGMSHAYSFGLCNAFLLVGRRLALAPRGPYLLMLGALLGLIVLIRPMNGLILLALPILFDNAMQYKNLLSFLRNSPVYAVGAGLLAALVLSLQFSYYRWATGHWIVYSYGEEGFNWSDPHMLDLLWSYRKGLFVYTPMALLACAGLVVLWRHFRGAAVSWLLFFTVLTYVLSSWWNWWYGGSFGSRVFVEYLGLFALPFALALTYAPIRWRRVMVVCSIALILVCQIQTYQARYYRIHWSDMNKERYWDEFLRIDRLTDHEADA